MLEIHISGRLQLAAFHKHGCKIRINNTESTAQCRGMKTRGTEHHSSRLMLYNSHQNTEKKPQTDNTKDKGAGTATPLDLSREDIDFQCYHHRFLRHT